ncbi:hypothetical protein FRC00_002664 [Tulasnella sp. 408]|nr:hypothetical protein FRC00_002664 [Tulasnella sp. 408]
MSTDAVIARKAKVQVPPTAVLVPDHNKVGVSDALPIPSFYGTASSIVFSLALPRPSPLTALFVCVFQEKTFSIDPTISISTEPKVTSEATVTSIVNVALAFKLAHRAQTLCNSILHWWKHGLGQVIDGIVVFYLHLGTLFAVGLALLRKRALQRPHSTPEPVVQFEGPRPPVAWIEIESLEGLLLLYSYTTNSPESCDKWKSM